MEKYLKIKYDPKADTWLTDGYSMNADRSSFGFVAVKIKN